jgi:hypothetical protein
VRPFLDKYCVDCHGAKVAKKRLRLDQLTPEIEAKETNAHWENVLDRLRTGQMPPRTSPQPSAAERKSVQEWLDARLAAADASRQQAEGRVVLRRLNRVEYQNTIHDLLGIETDLKEILPEDDAAAGFDNNAEALRLSPILLEKYLEAAEAALDAAIVNEARPETVRQKFRYQHKERPAGGTWDILVKDDFEVFFLGTEAHDRLDCYALQSFRAPLAGRYRIRISAFAYQSDKPVTMRVYGGDMFVSSGVEDSGRPHLVGYFEVPPARSTIVEFVDHLKRPGDTFKIRPYNTGHDFRSNMKKEEYKGAGLAVGEVDIEGPLVDAWPPESHRRLFGSLPLVQVQGAKVKRKNRYEKERPLFTVTSEQPARDAGDILRRFLPRAFRRPVQEAEVQSYLSLVQACLKEGSSFEAAVRVGLKAVLCSPHFLFLKEKPGRLECLALAARLSYFLWSSMPDQELLDVAARGTLNEPDTLRKQVERMLRDQKARRFTENFVGQWLGLRDIDSTTPDALLYPEFDELLRVSMVKETELFFEELLRNDLSLLNFVDSDFSLLNERLARHYGIPGVEGLDFRKVKLPPQSGRGGVLCQASVLKVTANGTTTSPVLRGAWILKNILGRPAPPPPANVAAIEPDIRGAVTIREQLAKHRQIASCAACHNQIDPPGFALECFDPTGGRRSYYRATAGKPVNLELAPGRRVRYCEGKPVDATGQLPGGKRFRDVTEFKTLLLEDRDQIARALSEKLLGYATGSQLRPADRILIEELVERARRQGYGLKSLIHEVVQSRVFLCK